VTGQYVLDCSRTPYLLDLKLPSTAANNGTIVCSAPPVPCIAQVQGDELHLCCPCTTAMERPEAFEGPGYCLMSRAGNDPDAVKVQEEEKAEEKEEEEKKDSVASNVSNIEQVSTVPSAFDLPVKGVDEDMKHGSAKFAEAGVRIDLTYAVVGIGFITGALLAWRHWRQR